MIRFTVLWPVALPSAEGFPSMYWRGFPLWGLLVLVTRLGSGVPGPVSCHTSACWCLVVLGWWSTLVGRRMIVYLQLCLTT